MFTTEPTERTERSHAFLCGLGGRCGEFLLSAVISQVTVDAVHQEKPFAKKRTGRSHASLCALCALW
jgi:hypothetical protein